MLPPSAGALSNYILGYSEELFVRSVYAWVCLCVSVCMVARLIKEMPLDEMNAKKQLLLIPNASSVIRSGRRKLPDWE